MSKLLLLNVLERHRTEMKTSRSFFSDKIERICEVFSVSFPPSSFFFIFFFDPENLKYFLK